MTFSRSLRTALLVIAFLVVTGAATAQDEDSLYAPAPPPDAAFVRILTTTPIHDATIGDATYNPTDSTAVTPYRVIPQGTATYRIADASGEIDVEAGSFYTLALTRGDAILFHDAAVQSRAKAVLALYNLTDAPLSLMTADGATPVLPDVPAGQSASVEVNPVAIDFAVFDGSRSIAPVEDLRLSRGNAFSVFALPGPDGVHVFHAAATTDTE